MINLDEYIYHTWTDFNADAQIIRTSEANKYILFCWAEIETSPNYSLKYLKIDATDENPVFDPIIFPYCGTSDQYEMTRTGFIISNYNDCMRYMYAIYTMANDVMGGYGGLVKYSIDENGEVECDETLISDDNNDGILIEEDYYGYNLEMQNKNETEHPKIAWISAPNSSEINSRILFYDEDVDDEHYALDFSEDNGELVETGRIAGIEFSPFPDEQDYMYVSCENLGLIKINWHDGSLIEQYTSAPVDFSHTSVQTAPDGNVYAVSDDGTAFGMVNKAGNHAFNPIAFQYPFYVGPNGVTDTKLHHINFYPQDLTDDGIKYYTLPENDLAKLTAHVATQDNLCDIVSGSANISITGGVPEYSLFVEYFDEEEGWIDVTELFFYNEETKDFEAPNLMMGNYRYTINDARQCEEGYMAYEDYFEIGEGDIYDFYDNLLTINSTTAPNIHGLDDLVWDQNDNDPENGFLLDNTIMFKHGFRLNGNTTLTINNLKLEFDEDYLAKVIIEPGSKLILNNCTLTNYHCWDPDAKWAGIEVWGNKNMQQTEANQGKLVMNGSTIEHTHEAVQLWEPGNYNSSGGMIYAENSTFKNNRRAISFLSYIYTHPVLGYDYNYYSLLDHCNFINNEEYIDDNEFFSFISMWAVKGVSIKACNFNAGNENGNGINTIDAGFTLSSHCNGAIGPDGCLPQYLERCEFYNLDKAIYARNTDPGIIYPINIQHSYFYNNNYGAYLSGLYNVLRVNTSEFVVGNNGETKEKALCGEFFGRGIHIEGSNGFEIENNKFYKNTGII